MKGLGVGMRKQYPDGSAIFGFIGLGGLKEWNGIIKRKRRGMVNSEKFNISKYFKEFSGDAYITEYMDGGKTLYFTGSGPLKFKGKEVF